LALVILGRSRLLSKEARLLRFVPAIGVAVGVIMAFSLLGYLFGALQFYTMPWLTAIALPAAAMILAVGIGLICSVPEHDPLLLLRERSGRAGSKRDTGHSPHDPAGPLAAGRGPRKWLL
jgi:hypothetical protein